MKTPTKEAKCTFYCIKITKKHFADAKNKLQAEVKALLSEQTTMTARKEIDSTVVTFVVSRANPRSFWPALSFIPRNQLKCMAKLIRFQWRQCKPSSKLKEWVQMTWRQAIQRCKV